MSDWTPGPWTGWYTSSEGGQAWAIGPEGCTPCVAIVNDDPDGGLTDGATIEANARLIAAAPDLYEACRAFVAAATSEWGDDDPDVVQGCAAIAKAEGREP